jgi:hypothetical protein
LNFLIKEKIQTVASKTGAEGKLSCPAEKQSRAEVRLWELSLEGMGNEVGF